MASKAQRWPRAAGTETVQQLEQPNYALWHDRDPLEVPSAHKDSLRVLVADSCRDTADSLSLLVRMWGHDVRTTYDGAAALETALVYLPDVLLSEIAMSPMNGCNLARKLRDQLRFESTLLIAVTGWADEGHRRLGTQAGFDLYLIKPVRASVIEAILLLEWNRLSIPCYC
jgi:CheY-like chemotaxis protein